MNAYGRCNTGKDFVNSEISVDADLIVKCIEVKSAVFMVGI